jgi:anaerobic ribonucleoside-triphosphate reductase activating protein
MSYEIKVPILGYNVTLNDDPQRQGVGLTIFFAGCIHNCHNCQNKESHNSSSGKLTSLYDIKRKIESSSKLVKSIIFSGGDPILREKEVVQLAIYAKQLGLKTILYTGFKYDDLRKETKEIIDVIVDGRYEEGLKQNIIPASSNQNIYIKGRKLSLQEIKELPINA